MIDRLLAKFRGSLDRLALKVMAALAIVTVLMLAIGDRSTPYVRAFSWQDRQIGAEDAAFSISFSRAMTHQRVEAGLLVESGKDNLRPIGEVLPGKVSWSGKKLFYTLNRPVPYGNSYQLRLEGARAADNKGASIGRSMEPFTGKFAARPRQFAFIGADHDRRGRLMLATLGQPPQVLTPANLVVKDFRFLPEGQGLIFSALSNDPTAGNNQQIYRWSNNRTEVILDNRVYQNVKFDLTPDGKILVVQRVNAKDPKDYGTWAISLQGRSANEIAKGDAGQRVSQGGSFMVTPDGGSIAVAEGQGVAIKPLTANAQAIDFLPKFGMVLGFSPNGNAAVMQKFNDDYTRSMFLVTNQGEQKELLKVKGEIQGAQFGPQGKILYVIVAEATGDPEKETQYSNQPYLIAIDIPANKTIPLLKLQTQQGIAMSLAPDGRALLFDQLATGAPVAGQSRLTAPDGQDIQAAELWLLPLPESLIGQKIQPESLSLEGFGPRWSP